MTGRQAPRRYFCVPVELVREMDLAAIPEGAAALNLAAWSYAAANLTDGFLSPREAARLPWFTPSRKRALIAAGTWLVSGDRIVLTGFLDVNATRQHVEERRAANIERVHRFRAKHSGEPPGDDIQGNAFRNDPIPLPLSIPKENMKEGTPQRVDDGEGSGDPQHVSGMVGDPRRHAGPTRRAESRREGGFPSSAEGQAEFDRETGTNPPTKTKRQRRRMPPWDDSAWHPFSVAWHERGMREPPTDKQLHLLWREIAEFGAEAAADWLADAPFEPGEDPLYGDGSTVSYGLVRHVLAAGRREHQRVSIVAAWEGLTDAEKTQWFSVERSFPFAFVNPLQDARLNGEIPSDLEGDEDPLRTLLRRAPDFLNETRALFRPRTEAKPEADSSDWTNLSPLDRDGPTAASQSLSIDEDEDAASPSGGDAWDGFGSA